MGFLAFITAIPKEVAEWLHKNPAIKWAALALGVLWGVEVLGERAVDLWVKVQTAQPTIDNRQNQFGRGACKVNGQRSNTLWL